jgi:FixJ family two-component response regulator
MLNRGERQVLELSDRGWKAQQISRETGLSLRTVQHTINRYHVSQYDGDKINARIARGSARLLDLIRAEGGHGR